MAIYKRSVDFLPKASKEELEEQYKLSKTSIYAAILPLIASVIWVIAALINMNYKDRLTEAKGVVLGLEQEIESYNTTRKIQTEIVTKVEYIKETVYKDFYPQDFFDNVNNTIKSSGDAISDIYAYKRSEDGSFNIQGKARSFLDLAKIMVVFDQQENFDSVEVKSIYYDKEEDIVNFEINFTYQEEI